MVPPDSNRISPVPSYSGSHYLPARFAYRPFTVYGAAFQAASTRNWFGSRGPTTPQPVKRIRVWAGSRSLATTWDITFVFFSSSYLDVSVRRVRLPDLRPGIPRSLGVGFPIRIPADQRFFAAPRRFSQLSTSFIATVCLGIHRVPFSAFSCMACTTPGRARPPSKL